VRLIRFMTVRIRRRSASTLKTAMASPRSNRKRSLPRGLASVAEPIICSCVGQQGFRKRKNNAIGSEASHPRPRRIARRCVVVCLRPGWRRRWWRRRRRWWRCRWRRCRWRWCRRGRCGRGHRWSNRRPRRRRRWNGNTKCAECAGQDHSRQRHDHGQPEPGPRECVWTDRDRRRRDRHTHAPHHQRPDGR
jgi:hypothetical protein